MPVGFDRTDFFDRIIVTQSMKKILDSILRRLFECVIKIDIDDFTIFKKNKKMTM